jgi:hypothetical protein
VRGYKGVQGDPDEEETRLGQGLGWGEGLAG